MGCDLGTPEVRRGAADLHVIGLYPEPGAGLDCAADAADDCGVPRNAPFEIRFDRPLLPRTAVRQSIAVYPAGAPGAGVFFQPVYDPLERVVTFAPDGTANWEAGLVYEVLIHVPKEGVRDSGFLSYDGALLAKDGSLPLEFAFKTARADPPSPPPPPAAPTCATALGIFDSGGCLQCHLGIGNPPLGLALESGGSLESTAVGRVAHETDTAGVAGRVLVDPARFGVAMPIIAPGDPADSYLLYKLFENPENYGTDGCSTAHQVALPEGQCLVPSPAEIGRMQNWFLRADPMPPPPFPGSLSTAELRALQDFVRAGASLSGCP